MAIGVDSIRSENGAAIAIGSVDISDMFWVVYSPNGPPAADLVRTAEARHIYGPWYTAIFY